MKCLQRLALRTLPMFAAAASLVASPLAASALESAARPETPATSQERSSLDPGRLAASLRETGQADVEASGSLRLSGDWRLPPGKLTITAAGDIAIEGLHLSAPGLSLDLRGASVRLAAGTRLDLARPTGAGGGATFVARDGGAGVVAIASESSVDVSGAPGRGGRILIAGDAVDSRGTLLARGQGRIEVEARRRMIFEGPADTAGGLVRLDPRNMVVAASDSNLLNGTAGGALTRSPDVGGDTGVISAATLASLLASNDVIVHTDNSGGAATGIALPAGFPGTPALDATGGDIDVQADVIWASEHFLWLLAHDDLIVRAKVQNAGGASGGSVVGIAGWDGTTLTGLDAAPLAASVYGNGTGDAYVLGPAGFSLSPTVGIAFGSRIADTVVAARDVRVQGSTDTNFNNGWAMVGYRIVTASGGASGDIRVLAKGAARILAGVSAGTFRWAQVGHGGCINRNPGNAADNLGPDQGDLSGDVLVAAGGPVEVKSGTQQAYGQIGNGGCVNRGSTRGNVSGDIQVVGESVLVQIPSGAGIASSSNYATIGNGGHAKFGRNTMGTVSGDIRVETTAGDLDIDPRGSFQLGEAKIGNGGATNTTADEGNSPIVRTSLGAQSGDITVIVARDLLMQGSNVATSAYSQIGHGGSITSAARVGPASGAIDVTVGRDAILRSTALTGTHLRPAHIGHGGWQRGVFVVPGATPSDPPLVSAERLAITDAPLTLIVARELRLLGGTRQLAYTQIGHGGFLWSEGGASVAFAGAASDVTVEASTIEVRAGSGNPSNAALVYSQIGNGGGSVIVSANGTIDQGPLSGVLRVSTTGATCRVGPPPPPVPPEPVLADLTCGDLVLAGSPTADLAAHAWIGHGGEALEIGAGVASQAGASGDVTVEVEGETNLLQGTTDFWRIGHFLLAPAPITAANVTLDTATLDFTEASSSTSATISDARFWPRFVHDAPPGPATDYSDNVDGGRVTLRARGDAGTDGSLVIQQPLSVPAATANPVVARSTDDLTLSAAVTNDGASRIDLVADDATSNQSPPGLSPTALFTIDPAGSIGGSGDTRVFAVSPGQFTPGSYVAPATAFGVWFETSGAPVVGANFKTPPPGADLVATKTDSPDPVTPGTNLVYTITVANNGSLDSTSTTLDDTLPAGTTFVSLSPSTGCTTPAVGSGGAISCALGTLPAGNSLVFTLTVQVSPAAVPGAILINEATAGSATAEANPGDETGTAATTVGAGSADLSVTKTEGADPVTAGSNLVYTITITNNGPSDAASVSLSDTLPTGTTFVSLSPSAGCTTPAVGSAGSISCALGTIANGGSVVLTLTVAVDPGVSAGTVITNEATAGSTTADPGPGANTGSASTTVAAQTADLAVTKTDTPDPVTAGGNIVYTITVRNDGPDDAASVSLSDTLPAGTTFVSLSPSAGCTTPAVGSGGSISCALGTIANGGSVVLTLTVAVDAGVSAGTVITNEATAGSTTADPGPGVNTGSASTTVAAQTADLAVTKTDTPDPVTAGGNIVYTITIRNDGPEDAASVSLSDTLPAGTTFVSLSPSAGCTTPGVGSAGSISCALGTIANGGSVILTLTVAVDAGVSAGTVITNEATAGSTTADPGPGVNTGSASTTVEAAPAQATLSAAKTVDGSFTPGSTVTYTLVLSNTGGTAQLDNPGDELTDVLPLELTLVSASATSGTATATIATNTVTWNGPIPAFGSVTLTVQATLPPDAAPGTTISNQATFAFDGDGDGTNESSGVSDDPSIGGASDPTEFVVGGQAVLEIPTTSELGLAFLCLLLACLGVWTARRLGGG